MKYLFIVIFIVVFITCGLELGYSDTSPYYTHFTYMFQHAGIGHLAINSLSFFVMCIVLKRLVRPAIFLPISMSCAFFASLLSELAIPTVGASGMIYAMAGGYFSITLLRPSIKILDIKKYIIFPICIAISLSVGLITGKSNFWVHIFSLDFGFFAFMPLALWKPISTTAKRSDAGVER